MNAALRFLNEKYVFFVADDRRWSHQWLRAASVRSFLNHLPCRKVRVTGHTGCILSRINRLNNTDIVVIASVRMGVK